MIKANYCSGICIDQYAMKRDAYLLNALACSRQLAPAKGIGKCMVEDFDFPLCLELMVNTAIKTRLLFENNQADIPLPNPKVAHLVGCAEI